MKVIKSVDDAIAMIGEELVESTKVANDTVEIDGVDKPAGGRIDVVE